MAGKHPDPVDPNPHFSQRADHSAWGSGTTISVPEQPAGFSLFEAAWRSARDAQAGREFFDLFIRDKITSGNADPLTIEDLKRLVELQTEVEVELLSKLVKGELVATWFPPGRSSPEPIHPDWWRRARLDLWLSQARAGDTTISTIKVTRPTVPDGPSPVETVARTDKTNSAESAETECGFWLIQTWPQSKDIKKPDWLKQAQQKWNGLMSGDAFGRAWAMAAKHHPAMSRRGRPSRK